jgi:hypothetical protein
VQEDPAIQGPAPTAGAAGPRALAAARAVRTLCAPAARYRGIGRRGNGSPGGREGGGRGADADALQRARCRGTGRRPRTAAWKARLADVDSSAVFGATVNPSFSRRHADPPELPRGHGGAPVPWWRRSPSR